MFNDGSTDETSTIISDYSKIFQSKNIKFNYRESKVSGGILALILFR